MTNSGETAPILTEAVVNHCVGRADREIGVDNAMDYYFAVFDE